MRLHAYLDRIGADRPAVADAAALRLLHVAHREAFLFENLSIQEGGGISVALEDIERKFLDEGNGGYCFEHNTLFAAALREIGFRVLPFLGRVRGGPPERRSRTHMVLRVDVDGDGWLADVGFGALGLLEPIRLREGASVPQTYVTYHLRRDDQMWVLSCDAPDASGAATTMDLYEFVEDPQTPGDVEVANYYTSTHPDSVFRRSLTIQRTTRRERTILRDGVVTRYRDGRVDEEPFDRSQLAARARDLFGVELRGDRLLYEDYLTGTV